MLIATLRSVVVFVVVRMIELSGFGVFEPTKHVQINSAPSKS